MSNENTTLELGQFTLDLKRDGFNDEKEVNKFIKACVRIARSTPEYRDWVTYVKDMLGFNTCMFTNETADELSIEIHHHPLTLYDLVSITINTYLTNKIPFSSVDIVREVLTLHYTDHIGYIPMVTSLHEKYHNGFLTIPPKFIQGVWNYLLVTPGYAINEDVLVRTKELMNPSNNKFDNYNNWQKSSIGEE